MSIGFLIAILLLFGYGPAILAFMGCVSIVDRIRRGKRLGPIGDRRTLKDLFPAASLRMQPAPAQG